MYSNLQKSFGLTEQNAILVSSLPTITVGPSLNLTKQHLVGCPIGRNEFHQKEKYIERA